MIKKRIINLLASLSLIICCALPLFSFKNDKIAKAESNNTFNSYYCLRDTVLDTTLYGSYEFRNIAYTGYNGSLDIIKYYEVLEEYQFVYVSYDSDLTVEIGYYDENAHKHVGYTFFYDSFSGVTNSNMSDYLKTFAIYYFNSVILSNTDSAFLNNLFGRSNSYMTTISGWYTLERNSSVGGYDFDIFGSFTYNNNLYNYITYTRMVSPELRYGFIVDGSITGNSAFDYPSNIYFSNVLVTVDMLNVFEDLGVFEYINELPQSGFGDLFYSLADTPIYFIVRMFDFELFGVTFYIAFFSIVTVLIIGLIIKKVI